MRVLVRIKPKWDGHALLGAIGKPEIIEKVIDLRPGRVALAGGPLLNEAEAAQAFGSAPSAPPACRSTVLELPVRRNQFSWTGFEDAIVREHYSAGGVAACRALLPRRSEGAIYSRAFALGVKAPPGSAEVRAARARAAGKANGWTEAEDAIIRESFATGGSPACQPLLPKRTRKAIQNRAQLLGVEGPKAPPPKPKRTSWKAARARLAERSEARPNVQPCAAVSPPADDRAPLGDRRFASPRPVSAPTPAERKPVPVGWAERHVAEVQAAKRYLEGRGFSVQRADRDEPIAAWRVSGWTGTFSNQQLIDYAERAKFGATAQEAAE